jgi:protein-L-isoaspartate(D-aspartate) O-methyltransferase
LGLIAADFWEFGMNFDQARRNMVEQQVRSWEVLDQRVLDILGTVHREDFVLAKHRRLAYADLMLPLGNGEQMMKPVVEGRMLQALALEADDEVLEIGTGSGYITACIAALAATVLSVDIDQKMTEKVGRKLKGMSLENVTLETGDALGEWSPERAFDAVVVTGSAPAIPDRFLTWVKPGGRLFQIRGQSPVMEAVLMTRLETDNWATQSLFETDLPRLSGAEEPEVFTL